ncbi:hypothetical protein [Tsuneonella sp. HG222]
MATKLFLDERELRQVGVGEANMRTLRALTAFINTQNELAAAQAELEAAQGDIADQGDAIDAANTDIAAANAAINALDARLDAYDALDFVEQDQAARPSHTPFAGVTASNPPTQGEVQAISDGLVSQSTTIATLLTRLDTVNLLT